MLQTKRALVMAILIAVVAGTAGIAASTMVAKPVYAASGSPIPGCYPTSSDTRLTLEGVQLFNMGGKLVCEKGTTLLANRPGVEGATITFTGSPNTDAVAKTDSNGNYHVHFGMPKEPGTYNIQAHFSGATLPGPSGVPVFFTGSDSDIMTIHVK